MNRAYNALAGLATKIDKECEEMVKQTALRHFPAQTAVAEEDVAPDVVNKGGEEKESNFTTFGKSFGMAKQWSLQKLGKALPTPEAPEFLSILRQLDEIHSTFTKLERTASGIYIEYPEQSDPCLPFLYHDVKDARALVEEYSKAKLLMEHSVAVMDSRMVSGKDKGVAEAKAKKEEAVEHYLQLKRDIKVAVDDLKSKQDEVFRDAVNKHCLLLQSINPAWKGGGLLPTGGAEDFDSAESLYADAVKDRPPDSSFVDTVLEKQQSAGAGVKTNKKGKQVLVLDESLIFTLD